MPIAVVAFEPVNRTHRRRTVGAIEELICAVEPPGGSEPPRPGFQLAGFVDSIVQFGLSRW